MSNTNQKNVSPLTPLYWQADTHACGSDFFRLSSETSGLAFGQLGSRSSYVYPVPYSVYSSGNIGCPWLELDTSISGIGSPGHPDYSTAWHTFHIPWYHQIQHNAIGIHVQFAVTANVPVIMRGRTQTMITSVTTVDSEDTPEIQTKPVSVTTGEWLRWRGLYWGDCTMYVYEPEVPADRCVLVVPLAKLARTSPYAETNDPPMLLIHSVQVWDAHIKQTDMST